MKCFTRQSNGDLVITVRGGFYSQGIVKFCSMFSKLTLGEHRNIVIDLAGVDDISFKAVGLLTEKMLAAEQAGSHCRLVNVSPDIKDKIDVTDSRHLRGWWEQQQNYSFF